MSETAVLILGHGSRAVEANEAMFKIIEDIRQKNLYCTVEPAFLEMNKPDIEEGFAICVAKGASIVIVIPYFLHFGMHVQRDLPEILWRCHNKHPEVEIKMGAHIGYDPRISEIIFERITETAKAD